MNPFNLELSGAVVSEMMAPEGETYLVLECFARDGDRVFAGSSAIAGAEVEAQALAAWIAPLIGSRAGEANRRRALVRALPALDACAPLAGVLDGACLDLMARAAGLPLTALLGGRVRERVDTVLRVDAQQVEAADVATGGELSLHAPDVRSAIAALGRIAGGDRAALQRVRLFLPELPAQATELAAFEDALDRARVVCLYLQRGHAAAMLRATPLGAFAASEIGLAAALAPGRIASVASDAGTRLGPLGIEPLAALAQTFQFELLLAATCACALEHAALEALAAAHPAMCGVEHAVPDDRIVRKDSNPLIGHGAEPDRAALGRLRLNARVLGSVPA